MAYIPIQYRSKVATPPKKTWWSQLQRTVQQAAQSVSKFATNTRAQYNNQANRSQYGYYQVRSQRVLPPKPANPQQRNSQYGYYQVRSKMENQAKATQAANQLKVQQSTHGNWMQSFRANYPEFKPPTATVMPDTYAGQALRYDQERANRYGSEKRLLADTYLGQGASREEQLFGLPPTTQNSAWDTGGGGGGGYDYGNYYGGGGYGGGGGGGGYEPPKPEWWLSMLSWNINRPEGG